jgi:hypothetical protein
MAEASSEPLEAMVAFLNEQGWPHERMGDQRIVRSHFKGSQGEWICFAHYRPELDQYLFYSVAPLRAPAVLRPAVAEYLTRANWGLILGNFELDYSDGEVRFKTSIQLNGIPLTAALLRPLIFGNVGAMDQYLPGLQAVMGLSQTPSEAINAIEESTSEESVTKENAAEEDRNSS